MMNYLFMSEIYTFLTIWYTTPLHNPIITLQEY